MSCIKISDLCLAGLDLFQDSESFLNELTDQEMGGVEGGWLTFDTFDTNETNFQTLGDLSIETGINTKVVSVGTRIVSVKTKTVKTYGISYTQKTLISVKR